MKYVGYIEVQGVEFEVHAELLDYHKEDRAGDVIADPTFHKFVGHSWITGQEFPLTSEQIEFVTEQMVEDYYDRL